MVELPQSAAGVVEHSIENHPHIPLMGILQQFAERVVAPQQGIDVMIVVCVIPVIGGRCKNRREVEGIDPQVLQVVQALYDSIEIAALESVDGWWGVPGLKIQVSFWNSIGPGKAVWKDLIEDGVGHPLRRIHRLFSLLLM